MNQRERYFTRIETPKFEVKYEHDKNWYVAKLTEIEVRTLMLEIKQGKRDYNHYFILDKDGVYHNFREDGLIPCDMPAEFNICTELAMKLF